LDCSHYYNKALWTWVVTHYSNGQTVRGCYPVATMAAHYRRASLAYHCCVTVAMDLLMFTRLVTTIGFFKIKKYNSSDLMIEHHRLHESARHGDHTCMHTASIIGSSHRSPPPASASATAHQTTATRMRVPPPRLPSRLLSGRAHYLPNPSPPRTQLARMHEA
jgi:hypothetical protein